KLLLMVAMALVPLAIVVSGSSLIGARQARDLTDVESRLVPKLELGPRLEAEFERLRQNLQDAVAAQDSAGLDAAAETKEKLFALVAGAGAALTPGQAAALRWGVQDYYQIAENVSRRLIAGETGETLVDDIARMQAQQLKAAQLIKKTTGLDKNELSAGFSSVRSASTKADQFRLAIGLSSFALVLVLSVWAGRGILRVLRDLSEGFSRFATGDFGQPIPVTAGDDLGRVAEEANQMAASLRRLGEQRDRNDWLREGQAGLSRELTGDLDLETVTERALWFLSKRVGARAGALYLKEDEGGFRLVSQYALGSPAESGENAGTPEVTPRFGPREGLIGQAAQADDILVIDDPPPDYLRVRSGLGETAPRSVVFVPLLHLGRCVGVAELALLSPLSEQARELLTSIRQIFVIKVEAAKSRAALRTLLLRTQAQAERLATQEEELRLSNQELQSQEAGLRGANEELEAQRRVLSEKNAQLEDARERVQEKADELARVSSYKSQFLANMSHELRTPLNSMLLLSHLLSENETRTLTPKQVEHCRTIHAAGQDLLSLINQVLDLAKIEAGRQDILLESVALESFAAYAARVFLPLAAEKGIRLVTEVEEGAPKAITTDHQRVERILTNLLGNAIKFTEQGQVTLRIGRPQPDTRFHRPELSSERTVAFAVTDTGIGIPTEAHGRIFAPFEQVESHTQRRYTGTGLGLAIARESTELLGGELRLESAPGRGSTFTCYLPEGATAPLDRPEATPADKEKPDVAPVADDRENLVPKESHLLVIEDDPFLAEQLVDIIHARKFKAVVATTGQEGLRLARELAPKGIILDVKLPDIDGWTVMERLSQDVSTRAVPVHFISGVDTPERGLSLGALGYLTKPATRAELSAVVRTLTLPPGALSHRILVVEDSTVEGESIVELLQKEDLEARHVGSAAEALAAIEAEDFGCIILDLGLPDMDGLGLLETLRTRPSADAPRVVVHTGRALTKKEARQLEAYAEAVILKDGRSEERLLEEIRLFIRHLKDRLPRDARTAPSSIQGAEVSLSGRTILLAEDDMRTVYALSALLRGKGAEVLVADTGREALEVLAAHPEVSGVLMDVMMPEMDGYEAMRQLRLDARLRTLPVIALTAKAMKGERERCLAAGATDYLTKPVDGQHLLATLKAWLDLGGSNGAG
ncbi:MAG TPA: response regulator, partial [Polyangiaceae bacterium]